MKFRNMLAAASAVTALAASMSASALVISTATIGGQTAPYTIAAELDVSTDADAAASLVALLEPTTGSLPAGNVLLVLNLTNATFSSGLTGSNLAGIDIGGAGDCSLAAASISSGGTAGSSSVTFLVSNAQGCEVAPALEGLQFTGAIRPAGTGTVSVTMSLTTEASNPVDGPAASATIVTRGNGFQATAAADTATSEASLPNFLTMAEQIVGTVGVTLGAGVKSDFAGADVAAGDLASVTVSVSGDMSAYASGAGRVFVDLDGDTVADANELLTISGSTASKVFTGADVTALTTGAKNVRLLPNGTTAIQASSYTTTITVNPDVAAALIPFAAADEVLSNVALQSVTREGTQITMPWFASGTQAAVTGSNNLVRIGNTSNTAVTAVYALVLNASNGAFVNPGVVPLGITIPAGGTTLISSQQIETAVGGNWGTGDVQITVEAPETSLTARRLIFNGASFTAIDSGTVFEDNN